MKRGWQCTGIVFAIVFAAWAYEAWKLSLTDALERANLSAQDVDAIFSVSVTGIAAPSIEARMANRLPLRPDVKRIPIFGLGCVAGTAGIARAADYVKAWWNVIRWDKVAKRFAAAK